jgi:hypothetical protein
MNFKLNKKMKIKGFTVFLLFFLAPFLFQSCKKENMCDCIKRTGDIIKEIRHPGTFENVIVEDNLNVYFVQDSVFEVMVQAGENIVPLIRTEVEGNTLYIRNDNRCNWTRSYDKPFNVVVRLPDVKFITHMGTGKIKALSYFTTDTVDLETKNSGDIEFSVNNTKIRTHMFGYGDITLHGTSSEHACSIGGDGFLYAIDLHVPYTWIQTFTSGLSYIYTTNLLICTIDKDGDVYCFGNPAVVQKVQNGTGQLYLH